MGYQKDPTQAPEGWRYRAVAATHGNSTPLGALILAIIGKSRLRRAFGPMCEILPNGDIYTSFVNRDGALDTRHKLWLNADTLRRALTALAEDCKMSDADCDELFAAFRAWVHHDLREGGTDLSGWYRTQLKEKAK